MTASIRPDASLRVRIVPASIGCLVLQRILLCWGAKDPFGHGERPTPSDTYSGQLRRIDQRLAAWSPRRRSRESAEEPI